MAAFDRHDVSLCCCVLKLSLATGSIRTRGVRAGSVSPSPAEPGRDLQLSAPQLSAGSRLHVKLGSSHGHLNIQLERQHQVSSRSGVTSSGYSWTEF